MDIKQLKRFLDLYQTGSFTKSADNLFISQQALSDSIQSLEQELGKALFIRTPKKAVPTDDGNYLQELCLPLVYSFDEMTGKLSYRFHYKKETLSIGLAPGVLPACSPDLLLRFRTAHPEVELKGIENRDAVCMDNVLNGTVELAFCPRPIGIYGLEYICLGRERIYAMMNKTNRLASRKKLNISDFKNEKLVSLNQYFQIHHTIIDTCRSWGFLPDFVVETGEIDILLSLVQLYPYTFICPEYLTAGKKPDDLIVIPIAEESLTWEYGLFYQKGRPLSNAAKMLIEFINLTVLHSS